MILLTTIATGLALFQLLVAIEGYRQIRRDVMKWASIQWFTMPQEERSYMRRQDGVMVAEKLDI